MSRKTVVKETLNYIETHLDEDLPLNQIADALHYSKFYLARIFAEETGCTVYKYIKRRRLTLAARKLAETKQPIVDIAYEAHYDSQQAFTLAFKQLYGCTPNSYRKNGVFCPKQPQIRTATHNLAGGKLAA